MAIADPMIRMKEMAKREKAGHGKIFTVVSGKGGVGKTNLALNLSIAIAETGKKTTLFDADTRLGNVDILLGRQPGHTAMDVVLGRKTLQEVMYRDKSGIQVISAGDMSGDFQQWEDSIQERFFHEIYKLRFSNDAVFIDTSAGLTEMMIDFALRADEILAIITPEPTAVSDAYALIKILSGRCEGLKIKAVLNMVDSRIEAEEVFERFSLVLEKFLDLKIQYGGYVLADDHMRQAVKKQEPLLSLYPASRAGKCIASIARELVK